MKTGDELRHISDEVPISGQREKPGKKSLASDRQMSEHLTPIFLGKYLDEFIRTEIARQGENKKMKAWQHAETVKPYTRLVPRKLQKNMKLRQTFWNHLPQFCHSAKNRDDLSE